MWWWWWWWSVCIAPPAVSKKRKKKKKKTSLLKTTPPPRTKRVQTESYLLGYTLIPLLRDETIMKTVSLFSGIGGLDLGLEDAGHDIILQVESDPHCVQVRATPARPYVTYSKVYPQGL